MARLVLIAVALAAACSAPPKQEAQQTPTQPPPTAPSEQSEREEALTRAEQELQYRREYADVMFRRHVAMAKRFRDIFELERALTEIESALRYKPGDQDARRIRAELLRLTGRRAGEVETIMIDLESEMQARYQQQVVSARRKLSSAAKALDAGDYEKARREYESALFIAETARWRPAEDRQMETLRREAKEGLASVPTEE